MTNKNLFEGMDILVLPDDDKRVRNLPKNQIGHDHMRFYVKESEWERIKDRLIEATRMLSQ